MPVTSRRPRYSCEYKYILQRTGIASAAKRPVKFVYGNIYTDFATVKSIE